MEKKEVVNSPEIVIALAGGVGTDFDTVVKCSTDILVKIEYKCFEINLFELTQKILPSSKYDIKNLKFKTKDSLLTKKMSICNLLRRNSLQNNILSLMAIAKIVNIRLDPKNENLRTVYIINSLKRPEEFKLLRQVYGRNFILLSLYSPRRVRINFLEEKIYTAQLHYHNQKKSYTKISESITSRANKLVDKDEAEINPVDRKYGQDLRDTFPLGHYFIRCDLNYSQLKNSISRFISILFGHPFITPTKDELNMYIAKGVSFRSADPSRQVGAVICNNEGAVIATGCNDVPKFGGGLYWEGDQPDNRDFQKNSDSNYDIKQIIIKEIIAKISPDKNENFINKYFQKLKDQKIRGFDALEYGRAVHAEEAAICDAAMRGVSLKDCTLYCTTFPCHLCTKHIIAVGIKNLIYIDPYPKSLASKLFSDEVEINPDCLCIDKVIFEPFIGVSPKRFHHVFKFDGKDREEDDQDGNKLIKKFDLSEYRNPKLSAHRSYLSYFIREMIFLDKLEKILENELNEKNYKLVNESIDKLQVLLKKYTNRKNRENLFGFLHKIEIEGNTSNGKDKK